MKRNALFTACLTILLWSCSITKNVSLTDDQIKVNLKKHISYLASDDLKGRDAGSEEEVKAGDYIISSFKKAGLKAKGGKGFRQSFQFTYGASTGKSTQLIVNNSIFVPDSDFYILPYSGNGVVTGYIAKVGYGISDQQLKRDDYFAKGNLNKKIFLIETSIPDGNNPHGKFGEWDLRKKIETAIAKGAVGVIFINTDTTSQDPNADWIIKTTPVSIPVVFAKSKAASLLKDSIITNCTLGTEVIRKQKNAANIIGYIDNKAEYTIVVGAHYDHLGMGEDGSLYRGTPAIHNGADDNASGVAGLIETARYVKVKKIKGANFLFIAFSGEEKGLLGSNYYVKHPVIPNEKISCMINFDMLGRLKKEEPVLLIHGVGTSPVWKQIYDTLSNTSMRFKIIQSGVGPSDHTSFYLSNIPVLHYFSGTHSDYHKPSDDEDKINYEGEMEILKVVQSTINAVASKGKLPFTQTKEEDSNEAPRFKVTLGVVPDYSFEGEGMRIDGVTEGKPASFAGLKPGDVVIAIDDNKVADMMSYMKALGKYAHGDKVKVKVLRDNKEMIFDLVF